IPNLSSTTNLIQPQSATIGSGRLCLPTEAAKPRPPGRPVLLLRRAALGALGAVLRPALGPLDYANRIQRSANDVVAHAWQVLHAASADQHNRVLLQVVAFARNVRRNLDAVGQAHA